MKRGEGQERKGGEEKRGEVKRGADTETKMERREGKSEEGEET